MSDKIFVVFNCLKMGEYGDGKNPLYMVTLDPQTLSDDKLSRNIIFGKL